MTPEEQAGSIVEEWSPQIASSSAGLPLKRAIALAIVEAELRGAARAIEDACYLVCLECKRGTPIDRHWGDGLTMHLRGNMIIRCQAPQLRAMIDQVAP